jgi:tRNA uridine 5-carboxymethylaminomethyl modification enzyme
VLDLLGAGAAGLDTAFPWLAALGPAVRRQIEAEALYAGYLRRQEADIRAIRREEAVGLQEIDFAQVGGLRRELREKLTRHRPASLGAAGRIEGMTPAALASILAHVRKRSSGPEPV